jgi:hypothetical protein
MLKRRHPSFMKPVQIMKLLDRDATRDLKTTMKRINPSK